MESVRVVQTVEEYLSLSAAPSASLHFLALYSSQLNAIITHPGFFSVTISDQLTRGYGVFDSAIAVNSHIYQLDKHLNRLLLSAQLADIVAPVGLEDMRVKVGEVLEVVKQDCRVRLFISSGRNEEGIERGVFYILAYNEAGLTKPTSVREATVSVPPKPPFLSVIKSNNYMSNSLCVLEAKSKGGYMGIQVNSQGFILESAVANVCAVLSDGRLLTPPADQVLAGTTIGRILELAVLLIQEGLITAAGRGMFTVEQAKAGQEVMIVGGDGIVGVTDLDGVKIGSGELGPVTRRLKTLLEQDKN